MLQQHIELADFHSTTVGMVFVYVQTNHSIKNIETGHAKGKCVDYFLILLDFKGTGKFFLSKSPDCQHP